MSYKNKKIYSLNSEYAGFWAMLKIKLYMLMHPNLSICIDMRPVKIVKESFLNFIRHQKNAAALLNLNAEIIAALGVRSYDKFVKIYVDENSFYENRRALVNRHFRVY